MDIYWYMVKWQIYSLYGRLGFLILYCGEQGLHNVPVLIYTFMIVRIDGPRGGVNWAIFKFLKQNKATLTYAILVRLNSPTG